MEIIAEKAVEKPICYVTSGEILASILREYKELYDLCNVYSGPYEVLERLAHKDKMYEYAVGKGLNVAKYATLDNLEVDKLCFPLFLKRNYEIPLFFKAAKINTSEEFQTYIKKIPEKCLKDVIAQEYIDIPENHLINISCQGFFVDGRCSGIYVANQKRKLRKDLTSYIEEITDSDVYQRMNDLTDDFMRELKYCGFAEFEFMYDKRNDNLWFVEVNTRTCGSQSGMNYKFYNLRDVILNPEEYRKLQPVEKPLRWMNIQRDIRTRLESGNIRVMYSTPDMIY